MTINQCLKCGKKAQVKIPYKKKEPEYYCFDCWRNILKSINKYGEMINIKKQKEGNKVDEI